jgi:hypothetical protein
MKIVLGLMLIIASVILGLYVGVWLCFIGGIVQVITEIRAEHMNATGMAIGIARLMFGGLAGWLSAAVLAIPGIVLMQD